MKNSYKDFRFMYVNPVLRKMMAMLCEFFGNETHPTRQKLIAMTIAMLYLNACPSVKKMFDAFLKKQSLGALTSFYYVLNDSKLFACEWQFILLTMILSKVEVIPGHDIVIIVDDSLVEKEGDHFELVRKLFDHCAKNGSCYLNGHCFVSIVILIPVKFDGKVKYLPIPLSHKMWNKESGDSKIKLAAQMIEEIYLHIKDKYEVVILCDSWYPKGELLDLHEKYNIPFICAVRSDTALYDLPTDPPKGKRGRKPIRGAKFSKDLNTVFDFQEIPEYGFLIGHKQVMTDIFGRTACTAYATKSKSDGNINLFLATNNLDLRNFNTDLINNEQMKALLAENLIYLPFTIYKFRWHIETCYYELKSFWGFCDYKLRSYCGIQNLINLQTLLYAVMAVIPYMFEEFKSLIPMSIQERRYQIGELIHRLINFDLFVADLEKANNSFGLLGKCEQYMENQSLIG